MNKISTCFADYWRNSLADADIGRGGWRKNDAASFDKCSGKEIEEGIIGDELVVKMFSGVDDEVESVTVVVRPLVMQLEIEHGSSRDSSMPTLITPVIAKCQLDRSGRLTPIGGQIFIARDLLDPLDRGSYAIGQVSDLDTFLTNNPIDFPVETKESGEASRNWKAFLEYARIMLGAVARDLLDDGSPYLVINECFLSKTESAESPAKKIIALYDYIRQGKIESPLFETATRRLPVMDEPVIVASTQFDAHLGHSSDKHALADAQRDAVIHLLRARHGEIVAVNGPPGTGKTTMLLTVVASLWVKAALNRENPPVIVAASTNNQAVTNIIDAFGKDFSSGEGVFAGRWIRGIKSFGVFLSSRARRNESSIKYQTQDFFDQVENRSFVAKARAEFLAGGRNAFPGDDLSTVEMIVERIHTEMITEASKLEEAKAAWGALCLAWANCTRLLGEDPAGRIKQEEVALKDINEKFANIRKIKGQLEAYLAAESVWSSLFSFIPAIERSRLLRAVSAIRDVAPTFEAEQGASGTVSDLLYFLQKRYNHLQAEAGSQEQLVFRMNAVLREYLDTEMLWFASSEALGLGSAESLDEVNLSADTGVRFKLFLLATHYWEGMWILETEQMCSAPENFKKKGLKSRQDAWRRRMMLTPCAVSTFYTLPGEMQYVRHDGGFINEYLCDFIDLLIVDEAGQVLPEVAGASFALAKQALVIGDTLQIEPIWSIPPSVDVGNLVAAGLIEPGEEGDDGFVRMQQSGRSASRGSVMAIAQFASRYHYDRDMPQRGLFLYEHRRCYDEIIDYCNRLCYNGKLVPKRGPAPTGGAPSMGYIHVQGVCLKSGRGGRANQFEAEVVAQWITDHKDQMLADYPGKAIHEIVAVVTPFAAQVAAVKRAAENRGLPVSGELGITIGTVHSLQGAERPIVLFSHVYTGHEGSDGGFIDASKSMLNVAVSRAKNSFIVFADMDLLSACAPGTPRGLLADVLLANESSRIEYSPAVARQDLVSGESDVVYLYDASEHDAFLRATLDAAKSRVVIVSPWITKEAALLFEEDFKRAAARGVEVVVFVDVNKGDRKDGNAILARKRITEFMSCLPVQLKFVVNVHSKTVGCDSDLVCMGSYNWLSAARGQGHPHKNQEMSMVYKNPAAHKEIDRVFDSMNKVLVK